MSLVEPDELYDQIFHKVSQIGELMLRGVLQKLIGVEPDTTMVLSLLEKFLSAGQNSVMATASLATAMLNAEVPSASTSQFKQSILTHHVFEVVFDTLDKGIDMLPEEKQRLIDLNNMAVRIIDNPEYDFRADYRFKEIEEDLDKNFPPYKLADDLEINVSSALKRSFMTIAELVRNANQFPNQTFANSFKESLKARYTAVSLIAQGAYKQLDDIESVLKLRQDAILIETTMKAFIMNLAQNDQSVFKYLENCADDTIQAIGISARLVGIWNDFGSSFTHDSNEIVSFFQYLGERECNIRDNLAQRLGGVQTNDVHVLSKDLNEKTDEYNWAKVLQILKDVANYEPNIALDFLPSMSLSQRQVYFFELHSRVDQMMDTLTRFYCSNSIPISIRNVIYKAMLFHYHIYNGHDYYNEDTTGINQVMMKVMSI